MIEGQPDNYLGSCGTNPFPTVEDLTEVVDYATNISKEEFIGAARPGSGFLLWGTPVRKMMDEYPDDFRYFKSEHENNDVFFFEHSAIEFFFRRST